MEEKRNLRAYYYTFESTGIDEIDAILEAVALAGKCFHHTSDWHNELAWKNNKSPIMLIQEAANNAAAKFKEHD